MRGSVCLMALLLAGAGCAEPGEGGKRANTGGGDGPLSLLPSASDNTTTSGPRTHLLRHNITLVLEEARWPSVDGVPVAYPIGFSNCMRLDGKGLQHLSGKATWTSENPTTEQLRFGLWGPTVKAIKAGRSPQEFSFDFPDPLDESVDFAAELH
ncbi:MAG TPA: hypothetical protein VI818_03600, partial [Candidatus Thermoplasmatota archaeon]|nr:hypothetical protein [Candidatus Thermoplasmatota archaeon]